VSSDVPRGEGLVQGVGVVAYGPGGGVIIVSPDLTQMMEEIKPTLILLTHLKAGVRAIPDSYV
jgi:hypothetical protein